MLKGRPHFLLEELAELRSCDKSTLREQVVSGPSSFR